MKVALIGNTCNNNFAFWRYLLDLGINAHLFLYSDEGRMTQIRFIRHYGIASPLEILKNISLI